MNYFESYALEKTNINGSKHVREMAANYDGKKLNIIQNIDGDVIYKTLSNGDILEQITNIKQNNTSLFRRLQREHKTIGNRSHSRKGKSSHDHKRTHKYRTKHSSISKKSRLSSTSKKSKQKLRKTSKKRTALRLTKQQKDNVTPDIMKTIY